MTAARPQVWSGDLASLNFESYEAGIVHWLRRDTLANGRTIWAGIWEVGPEDLEPDTLHVSQHEESFHLLEGRVRVQIERGPTLELQPGAIVSLPEGTRARWTILERAREFFVYT
jgi:uncharacterized protein